MTRPDNEDPAVSRQKMELRRKAAGLWRSIPPSELMLKHLRVIEYLKAASGGLAAGSTVALFGGLRSEPDLLGDFSSSLRRSGHRTAVFAFGTGGMSAFSFRGPDDLVESASGVWVPDEQKCPSVLSSDLDWVLVPGLAFSKTGDRLGRGRGYFDRLLAEILLSARVTGVTLDAFVWDFVPMDAHDQRVKEIVTESGFFVCG